MTWIVNLLGAGNEIPADYARLGQGAFRQVIYLGEALTFPLYRTWSYAPEASSPVHSWHVRRWDLTAGQWSAPVASGGAIAGGPINWTIPSSFGLADVPGYYRVFFERGSSIPKWGTAMGGGCFVVTDGTGRPTRPAIGVQKGGKFSIQDSAAAYYLGLGIRNTIFNAMSASGDVADITRNIENMAAVRPTWTRVYVSFSNVDTDFADITTTPVQNAVSAIVAGFASDWPDLQFVYDWQNEPGGSDGPGAERVPVQHAFHTAVKAGASDALVAGPSLVGLTMPTLARYAQFLAAGGGAYFEVDGPHTYNRGLGSPTLDAAQWGNYEHTHAATGQPDRPRMVTEGGDFYAAEYGAHTGWRQARMLLLDLLSNHQHKVANRDYAYFYVGYTGFGLHPPYLISDAGQPSLAVAAVLTMDQQLDGCTFDKPLTFGRWEDPVMRGSRYLAPGGGQVLAVGTFGRRSPTVRVSVAGAASSLDVIDALGGTTTAAVTGGQADVTIHGAAYIRGPVGAILDVVPGDYKFGALRTGTASSSHGSRGLTEISSIAAPPEGAWPDSLIADQNNQDATVRACWQSNVPITTTAPQWVQNTFGAPVGLDGVYLACPRPWQEALTVILHAQVQARIAGTWTTVATIDEDVQTIPWLTGYYDGFDSAYESGWDDTSVYELRFTHVTADAIRVLIADADGISYGGAPSLDAFNAFGVTDSAGNPATAGMGTVDPRPAVHRLLAFDSTVQAAPSADTGPVWLGAATP